MANTFSNIASLPAPRTTTANPLANAPRPTPLASALTNASQPVSSANQFMSLAPKATTPLKSTTTNNVDGSSTTHEYHAPPKDTGLTEQQVKDNLTKAGYSQSNGLLNQPTGNTQQSKDVVGQAPAGYSEYDTQHTTAPQPDNSFSGLIGQGTQYLNEAGKVGQEAGLLRQAISRETTDVMHNPYYSGSVRIGQSGAIQQNQGSTLQALTDQQKALTTQGQAYLSGASTAAPIQAPFTNQVLDPRTGQPIQGANAPTPFTGGQKAGEYAAGQNYAGMKIADNAARGIKNTIQSYISQNPSLNPSDAIFVNSIAQWAQGQQLGDPKYQTLANYLNEYISTLAPILGVGGDTTNLKTEIAQSFINAKASGQSISEVLNNIDSLAADKLKNIQSAGTGGGVVTTTAPNQSSGGAMFGSFF